MSSYKLLDAPCPDELRRRIIQAIAKLEYLELILLRIQIGRGLTMIVYPTRSTQNLKSVYTGQGWADGHFYKSYAAVIDDVTIVWHKPVRAVRADNVIPWPGQQRAAQ
ncbi:MAG TPA: hypothetical protein VIF37_20530 [Methylobacter sp.]|jgi:hypothetical protein